MNITVPQTDIASVSDTESKVINVVVALITRPLAQDAPKSCDWASEKEYFIAVRPDGPCAGQWEFPGGKIEAGETAYEALVREVQEEIGIDVHSGCPYMIIDSKSVKDPSVICRLHVWEVTQWSGQPYGAEGQEAQWSRLTWREQSKFLKPNRHMFTAMRLTNCLLVFNVDQCLADQQLLSHMNAWEVLNDQLDGALTVRLRANGLSADTYYLLVQANQEQIVLGTVKYIIDVLPSNCFCSTEFWSQKNILAAYFPSWWMNPDYAAYLEESKLKLYTQYPELLRGASCHSDVELKWACSEEGVEAHFYCLSPVAHTTSHPELSEPLGWQQWSIMNQLQQQPGYALGGININDLTLVKKNGGFGIAGMSCFQKETVYSEWKNVQKQLEVQQKHGGEFH